MDKTVAEVGQKCKDVNVVCGVCKFINMMGQSEDKEEQEGKEENDVNKVA